MGTHIDPHAPTDFDVLIVGGGMVGASLAAALAPTGLRVGVLEARPHGSPDQPSYDDRSIALAYGSRLILEGIGLWSALREQVAPIRHIHVSERGRFGATRLDHRDEGVPSLGYVVENRVMGRVLAAFLEARPALRVMAPARVVGLSHLPHAVELALEGDGAPARLRARLVVAADGTHSAVRTLLGIGTQLTDYGQSALIANVTPERDPAGVAYERFTDAGPIALLPMSGGRCSLVWTHPRARLEDTLGLDDAAFLARLEARFGHRLGRFLKVGARASYPLSLVRVVEQIRPRCVLIGNAAHTLHPVAGQGFNLALRDVALLAELLAQADAGGADPGDFALLERYAQGRRADLDAVARYTDTLARLFVPPFAPLAHARAAGLIALDLLAPLRHLVARQSMGLRAARPRLARGLPLVEDVA